MQLHHLKSTPDLLSAQLVMRYRGNRPHLTIKLLPVNCLITFQRLTMVDCIKMSIVSKQFM